MIAVHGRGVGRVENMGIRSWRIGQGLKHLHIAFKAVTYHLLRLKAAQD